MKFTLLLLSLSLSALAAPAPSPEDTPGNGESETPEFNGRYNAIIGSDDPRTLDELLAEVGLNRSDLRYAFDNSVFKGFSADLFRDHVSMLSTTSGFAAFEPDVKMQMADTARGTWGLKRISQGGVVDVGTKDLKGRDFENYVFDGKAEDLGKGVDIYILDSGVNFRHRDFGTRAGFGYSFDRTEDDDQGHGTHVAGIAGSTTYGVAKGANIISVRVGSKTNIEVSDVIDGIQWMIRRHESQKDLIEFRGSVASLAFQAAVRSKTLEEVVKGASKGNIHFTLAAGNDKRNACKSSPARVSKDPGSSVVTVGAINVNDRRSKFSNFGSCVTVYAPGEDIRSLGKGTAVATKVKSGTSMACPHIAGLMAVFLAQDQSLRFDTPRMKQKIIDMAQKVELEIGKNKAGDPGIVANNGILRQ